MVQGRVERRVRRNEAGEERDEEGGWPFDEHGGPSMDVRRGPWRHTCTSPRHPGESKQPYKVAGLRFNPKFISSISKGLSRDPSVSERLTRTTLPLRHCAPLLPVLSRPLLATPFLLFLAGTSECTPVHRCIASTPLHYDSYIAIFIISAAHRCPRSRLTSVVSSYSSFSLFPRLLSRAEPLLFWQITAGEFKAPRRDYASGGSPPPPPPSPSPPPRSLNGELTRGDIFGCPFRRRDENSRGLIRRCGEQRFTANV